MENCGPSYLFLVGHLNSLAVASVVVRHLVVLEVIVGNDKAQFVWFRENSVVGSALSEPPLDDLVLDSRTAKGVVPFVVEGDQVVHMSWAGTGFPVGHMPDDYCTVAP
jgi:hypothetical protein